MGKNFSLMVIYLLVYDLEKYIRHILIYGLYCVVCVCMCCVRMYKCVRAMVSLMMVLPRYKWIYNARYVRKKGCMDIGQGWTQISQDRVNICLKKAESRIS